MASGLVDVLF